MKEFRKGKKEERRERTAREQQTYDAHKAASRRKSATFEDPSDALAKYGVPWPTELQRIIDALLVEYRYESLEEDDYPSRIFDPDVHDLREVAIGILDHKEVALPPEMVPQGPDGREKLRALCERMIIRNRNPELVSCVVNGWPGVGSVVQKLDRHVNDLWRLSQIDFGLYTAIVCGQHGQVLYRMKQKMIKSGIEETSLIRMLVRHGLLWCANDIQLILARNALTERNPFGALLSSDFRKLEPTRVVNDLRPQYLLVRLLLDLYATTGDAKSGKTEQAKVPDDPIARLMKIRINHQAKTNNIDLMTFQSTLDETIPYLRHILSKGGKKLRRELEKPVSANELEKHFHGIWFSGLSNVQASAVPLLRYLQAETQLEWMVRDRLSRQGQRPAAREGVALPAFAEERLQVGWRSRSKDLLFLYRRELLDDADMPRANATRSKNAGWTAIQVASSFLQQRSNRLIGDDVGDENSPRKTFYMLDVIPEARLSR
jgi:hypothetical protein